MERTPQIKPIVAYGSKILREVCVPAENNQETQQLIDDMIMTLAQISTGVGLAANQINSNIALFIAKFDGKLTVHINPKIKKSRGTQKSEEGCLSAPNVFGVVDRFDIIDLVSYDRNFNIQKFRLRSFNSCIALHEMGHLNGILFTDLLTKEGKEAVDDKLSDISKGIFKVSYPVIFPDTDVIVPKAEKIMPMDFTSENEYTKEIKNIFVERGKV